MINVALVALEYSEKKIKQEYLGLARIHAFLKLHNINVELYYIDINKNEVITDIIPIEYNLIGFCLFPTNANTIYDAAVKLKERNKNIKICVGGYLATTACEFILKDCSAIDFTVMGDGEETMLKIIHEMENGVEEFTYLDHVKTRNDIYLKKAGNININDMPFPTREVNMGNAKYKFLSARLSASKGCTSNCSFCCVSNVYKKWDGRDVKNIYDEVIYCYENYGIRSFLFTDSSFEDPGKLGKQRVEQFCNLIKQYHVKFHFFCCVKASSFSQNDLALIQLMKDAGFTQVFIGVEANNLEDLIIYNKKASTEDNYRTYNLFNDAGIYICLGFIPINPYSTMDKIRENYRFLTERKRADINLYANKLQVYYSTSVYCRVKNDNLLKDDYSYINTGRYNYVDKDVKKLMEFIDKEFYTLSIFDDDYENQYFHTTWFILKALFPEIVSKYEKQFISINENLASEIKKLFDIIYIEFDLEKAKNYLSIFSLNMKKHYKDFNHLKMILLKNKEIREYIISSMIPVI